MYIICVIVIKYNHAYMIYDVTIFQPVLDPLGEFALRMRARAVSVNCRAHTETWRSWRHRLGKDEISLNHSLAMLGS